MAIRLTRRSSPRWRRPWRGVAAGVLTVLVLAVGLPGSAAAQTTRLVALTDQLQAGPFMGLGVELDPYDTLSPAQINWPLIEQRLDFLHPGFLRTVIHVSDYFDGFNANHEPVYNWTNPRVEELLTILGYAKSQGIPVVLGNWEDPVVDGDAQVPTDFIKDLRTTYGFTNIDYFNVENEPNNSSTCDFDCWASIMKSVGSAFAQAGLTKSVQLVGPDNENSWDDDPPAAALDNSKGLDQDNPLGGDAWVTDTLNTIPSLIGAYDSHRYATISGVENGVYDDQVRARRLEISNLDSPQKPYFAGEFGLTPRQTSPFTSDFKGMTATLRAELDPSSVQADVSAFVDDQPHITQFQYGTWMGDLMIQAINGGLSGASVWDFDDAMHNGGGYGSEDLKQWGVFNSLAGQDGYPASDINLRPWYYAWSTLSRAFPAGSQPLVLPSTGVPGVRVTAARIPNVGPSGSTYNLSLAVVNDSATARTITVTVPSVPGTLAMAQYDYFPTQQDVDGSGLPVPAQILQARPAAGITLQLPAEGMVVLSSDGYADPVMLDQGTSSVDDHLTGWQLTSAHSGLGLAHANSSEFNYARLRATPTSKKKSGYLVYGTDQLSSFQLQAYYAKRLSLTAYGSENGSTWWPIALESTQPAPAVGGHELLDDLLPNGQLPAGANRLKLVLGPGTELAQVQLAAGRSGSACVPFAGGATDESILGVAPGATAAAVDRAIGVPQSTTGRVRHYCVTGGGELATVFNRSGVELAATTGRGYRLGGIPEGASIALLTRAYKAAPLRSEGHGMLVSGAGIVYVIDSGRVAAEAVATPALIRSGRSLAFALKLAGV